MISARFFLAGEQYTGCEITGHADYSEEGTDVICAYVSAAVQTVANLMTEIFRLPVSAEETEEPARVSLRLSEKDDSGNATVYLRGWRYSWENCRKRFLRIFKSHTWRCKSC